MREGRRGRGGEGRRDEREGKRRGKKRGREGVHDLRKTTLPRHHHHHYRTTGLTWCKHSSASGPHYKVSVTRVVSVRRSGKTDTSSTQYGMIRRLTLT